MDSRAYRDSRTTSHYKGEDTPSMGVKAAEIAIERWNCKDDIDFVVLLLALIIIFQVQEF
jgi:3-oxoacyl-[acyl-carrier-protein] synthase III